MATTIIEELGAKTLFDLEGVVAVVTGGNSVGGYLLRLYVLTLFCRELG
jgi:hypothetical protein